MKTRFAVLLPFLLLLGITPADAATGDLGHDIGWPQCINDGATTSTPGSGTFGVVAVNHGSAWSTNNCLQAQATWAAGLPRPAMLYANTANPAPTSSFYWPTTGSHDPALCANAASTADPGCAYDYGWHTAGDALAKASAQTAVDPLTVTWWLDVEIANTWNGDGISNAADIQGMVDRLRTAGISDVGIYSKADDWASITSSSLGSAYNRATSSAYRAHWPFVPAFPIEDGPVWFAGLNAGVATAQSKCSTVSFTGGEKLLSQYDDPDSAYDGDYRCADADHTAPTAAMTQPASFVVTAPKVVVGWTGSDAGSGPASYDLQGNKAVASAGFAPYAAVGSRLLTTSVAMTAPARGTTACWRALTRDAAGNTSSWSGARCATTPFDDRDLSAGTGWARTIGASGWFASSYSSSTRLGASLSRAGLQTKRLVLLAYRCPTCGSVTVLVNGSTLRTVSLASSVSGRVQIALPLFSLRTATVTLKVATSGKLVRIDGLATSRV